MVSLIFLSWFNLFLTFCWLNDFYHNSDEAKRVAISYWNESKFEHIFHSNVVTILLKWIQVWIHLSFQRGNRPDISNYTSKQSWKVDSQSFARVAHYFKENWKSEINIFLSMMVLFRMVRSQLIIHFPKYQSINKVFAWIVIM